MDNLDDLKTFTKKETAERLNISVRQLTRLMANNEIKFGRIGRAVRFTPEQIRDYLKSIEVDITQAEVEISHLY